MKIQLNLKIQLSKLSKKIVKAFAKSIFIHIGLLVSFKQNVKGYKVGEKKMLNMLCFSLSSIIKISIFFIISDSYFMFAITVSVDRIIINNI